MTRDERSDVDPPADDGTGESDRRTARSEPTRTEAATAVARTDASPTLSADRRSLLKTMALPSLAAALAGCGEGAIEISSYTKSPGESVDGETPVGERVPFGEAISFEGSYELSLRVGTESDDADGGGEDEQEDDDAGGEDERDADDDTAGTDEREDDDTAGTDDGGRGGGGQAPTTSAVGRVHGRTHHFRMQRGDSVTESYLVDGDALVLTDEGCVRYPDVAADIGEETDPPAAAEAAVESFPGLVETGTATVDDRRVTVYELPAGSLPGQEQALTYYVDDESSHIRRLATAAITVEYGSWGDVEPIERPDIDCEAVER